MSPNQNEQLQEPKRQLPTEVAIVGLATIAVPAFITYSFVKNGTEVLKSFSQDVTTAYKGPIDHSRTFGGGSASNVSFKEKSINEVAMLAQHFKGVVKAKPISRGK